MNTSINHSEMPESFAPETVDEEIARYLGMEAQPEGTGHDAQLIHALAGYHTLPSEADRSLARVRTRVRTTAGTPGAGISATRGDANLHTREVHRARPDLSQRDTGRSPQSRHIIALTTPLRTVAAVLVVALLVGGFVAVLHLRGGRQIVAAPTWQNVGIARGKTHGQPLDFDPASGVGYAVSQSGGRIYAVGGIHLWYSDDSGATYQPFAPALPFIKNTKSYIISTVPGLSGVFASPGSVDNPSGPIYYAEAGASGWSTLQYTGGVHPIASPQSTVSIDPARIWKAIFSEYASGQNIQARAVGNWLFALAGPRDSGAALIGTPDFGRTWFDLSATMPEACTQFAVSPVDARQLFCLTSSSIEQTADGGLTWKQVVNASPPGTSFSLYTSIWASARAVYSYTYPTLNTSTPTVTPPVTQLARHPLGVGNWASATLPRLPQGSGGAAVIDVSPGDTVYALAGSVTAGQEGQTQVQISVLASGARQYVPVGEEATLPIPGDRLFFELGDIYSTGTPAVYAHALLSAQAVATQPLYRLALPGMDAYPRQVVTPLATPPLSATSTPVSHAACTTPGNVANIQDGGYGANIDTFAPRWGPSDGVAAGSELFGRWADGTPKVQVADAMPSNHRVYQMSYHVDKAQDVTQAQGEVLAKSILPKDAALVGRSQQDNQLIVTYCSAAIIAAFPPSVQDINGPLPHNGLIIVSYALRTDGNIEAIAFSPMQ